MKLNQADGAYIAHDGYIMHCYKQALTSINIPNKIQVHKNRIEKEGLSKHLQHKSDGDYLMGMKIYYLHYDGVSVGSGDGPIKEFLKLMPYNITQCLSEDHPNYVNINEPIKEISTLIYYIKKEANQDPRVHIEGKSYFPTYFNVESNEINGTKWVQKEIKKIINNFCIDYDLLKCIVTYTGKNFKDVEVVENQCKLENQGKFYFAVYSLTGIDKQNNVHLYSPSDRHYPPS